MSNVYADFNKWNSVNVVRYDMKLKRVAKVPSVIMIDTAWPCILQVPDKIKDK